MSAFSNFAVSFTIISILSGCLTLYRFGMNTGGPAVIVWGWLFVGVDDPVRRPGDGRGLLQLPDRRRPLLLVGEAGPPQRPRPGPGSPAGSTSSARSRSPPASTSAPPSSSTRCLDLQFGFERHARAHDPPVRADPRCCTACSTPSASRLVAMLNDISVWWHVVGVAVIVGALVFVPDRAPVAPTSSSPSSSTTPAGAATFYVVLHRPAAGAVHVHRVRRLRAHDRGDPRRRDARARAASSCRSWCRSSPAGCCCSASPSRSRTTTARSTARPACRRRRSSSTRSARPAASCCSLIVIVAQLFCGMASVTANSRMIYAFSRDGALPASQLLAPDQPAHPHAHQRDLARRGRARSCSACRTCGTPPPTPRSRPIAVIGLYIAYVMPTLLRLRQGDDFERGPWHLGRWSRPIGIVAVAWVAFITVLFMLPQVSPVTRTTFNYTPVAVLVVLGFAGIWWLVSARQWFTGPKVQGSPEELAAIERDLERDRVTVAGAARERPPRPRGPPRRGRGRPARHGPARHRRHAGPPAGQAHGGRARDQRRAARTRSARDGRGLRLPAGRRRRHEHRRRLRAVVLVAGLRRPGAARPDLDTIRLDPLARGDRADPLRRRAGGRHAGGSRRPARCCAASSTGWPSTAGARRSGPSWSSCVFRRHLRAGLALGLPRA